jgi:hypothetical protein
MQRAGQELAVAVRDAVASASLVGPPSEPQPTLLAGERDVARIGTN